MLNFDSTNAFMNNPAFLEMRLVYISNDGGNKRMYISGDGEKLIEFTGKTLEEVFKKVEEWCKEMIYGN